MMGHVATARYLISQGANPTASEKDGITPLHYAAQSGHAKLVKYLLSLGVPVDITCNHATGSPLLIAALCGQPSTVQVLLQHHADVLPKVREIGRFDSESGDSTRTRQVPIRFFSSWGGIPIFRD